MRIKSIHAANVTPLKLVEIQNLSDIVVLAGPNGVGKTSLIKWLLQFFQNIHAGSDSWIEIEATCPTEINAWGQSSLDTRNQADCNKLRQLLQQPKKRSGYVSSVLNFESDRSITNIQPYAFSWNYDDPFEENVDWNYGFRSLVNRFGETVHAIFRKVRNRRELIALKAEALMNAQKGLPADTPPPPITLNPAEFPDPITPFKDAFAQLLGPKSLVEPDAKEQTLFYSTADGQKLPITSLSSGEREVVNVVFDFILRNPSDSIVVFDEPELHLHPELSYKLIQTLRNAGARNQFIFCTHSAEIISASLDNSVVFISPPKGQGVNQAIPVHENDATHQALKLLGQSIGVVSLGKKIVLIEGDHGSLDKQTYGAILKGRYPTLVLVPSGGKGLIQSFNTLIEQVITQSLWGVDFFMVCDRDAVPSHKDGDAIETAGKGRIRLLKRYHLENYFLDESVISEVFRPMVPPDSWLASPEAIRACLLEIAKRQLSYAAALIVSAHFRERVGNLSIMPKGCNGKSAQELTELLVGNAATERNRMGGIIADDVIATFTQQTMNVLEASLATDEWKRLIPGRVILQIFCSSSHGNLDYGRFKIAYLKAASTAPSNPFSDVIDIFDAFAKS